MEAIKQIALNLPQGLISGLLLNGTVILLAYLLVWKKFKDKLKKPAHTAKGKSRYLTNKARIKKLGIYFTCGGYL